METSGWGGAAKEFVDVRIKDAQRAFNASKDARKVVLSSERVEGAEGGVDKNMDTDDKEERCISYEEDEEEEEEEEEKEKEKEQKEKEQEKSHSEQEQDVEKESEEEDEGKWGEMWEDMYGEGEHSIEEDANIVAKFANAGGYDVESESQNVAMVARLIRRLRSFREEREKEEEGGSRKEEEKESKKEGGKKKEEERESRRERNKEKETDKKARSRSRRDTSVEKRAKRPSYRQVRGSSSTKEDD